MKSLRLIAIIMALLIISLPIAFSVQLSLVYDANGNLVTGDGKYRAYNSLNQLNKVYNGSNSSGTLLQQYIYHPVEERVLVKYDYTKSETTYYWSQNFVTVVNASGTFNYTYVYFDGQLVAQEVNGVKLFISGDNKGSSSTITNGSGVVVENNTYSLFGEKLTSSNKVRYGYEGKEYDSVIGSTDFNFRRYNQNLSIFEQPDTLIQNVYDPQLLNRFSFERNNPEKNTDPTGHVADCVVGCPVTGTVVILWTVGGLMVSAGVFSAASYYYNKESNANNAYDYEYAIVGDPISGPMSDVFKQLEDMQRLKDLGDMTKDDLKKEGEKSSEPPFDINIYPPGIMPTTSTLGQMGNDFRSSTLGRNIEASTIKYVYKDTKTRVNVYHALKQGISSGDDPQAFYEAVRQAQQRTKKYQDSLKK